MSNLVLIFKITSGKVLFFKITSGNLLLGPAENRIYSTFCQKQTPLFSSFCIKHCKPFCAKRKILFFLKNCIDKQVHPCYNNKRQQDVERLTKNRKKRKETNVKNL